MNVLTDRFPTKIRIDDVVYEINADFRNCLKIIMAFEDDDLAEMDKYEVLVRRLYKTIPKNFKKAVEEGVRFLDCGEQKKTVSSTKRVYKFSKDGRYIYSAIKQTHQIDLEEVEFLHWWKFVFLFSDVKPDCAFSNMVYLRNKKNEGKLTKEERKIYVKSREILDINYDDKPSKEESEFMRRLQGG